MIHQTPLIATIVAGLGLAFILGLVAVRLRLSPLVGYLLAGVLIGPFTPGFVADQSLASQLAEIGIILLMFGVGLHFSLADLLAVRAIAVPGAIGQIVIATLLAMALASSVGWPLGTALIFGLALSVASTVVLLRALQERHLIESERGRIAIGWLIVEDLVMVLVLVLLPATAGLLGGKNEGSSHQSSGGLSALLHADSIWAVLGATLVEVAAFVGIMLIVGRRLIPWILHFTAHTGSRELFRLAVLSIALGVAFGAATLFGVSFALGAFFAGMVLAESALSSQAARETLPLRDAFAVLFFVSVGMLFDPSILVRQPLLVLGTVSIVVIGKSLVALLIVRAFGHPLATALMISASLAQVGEFSFILAGLGVGLGLLGEDARDLILATALISILINPLLFIALDRWEEAPKPSKAPPANGGQALTEDRAILVGYGRIGQIVGQELVRKKLKLVVIDEQADGMEPLREAGVETIIGSGTDPKLLNLLQLDTARWLVVTISDPFESGDLVERGRAANPQLKIIARAHTDAEAEYLKKLGADHVVTGEAQIARALVAHIETSS
ncbi:Kef family K(+) transporter [Beijerinckiaceae bacterium]|nr:Kef family K(+) transporter [Beijerinckiaceae bacterium]